MRDRVRALQWWLVGMVILGFALGVLGHRLLVGVGPARPSRFPAPPEHAGFLEQMRAIEERRPHHERGPRP